MMNLHLPDIQKMMIISREYKSAIHPLLLLILSTIWLQSSQVQAQNGSEYYEQKKYKEAIATWQNELEQAPTEWSLLYNIGNAWYNLNEFPKALYYYESAKKIAPYQSEINENIRLAQAQLAEHYSLYAPKNKLLHLLGNTPNFIWGLLALLLLITSYITFIKRFKQFKSGNSLYVLPTLLLTISLLLMITYYSTQPQKNHAIITAYLVSLKTSPQDNSSTTIQVPGGNKVSILKRNYDWLYVQLETGQEGWVEERMIKRI